MMNEVLRPFLRKSVVVFLDDILIFSRSWEDQLMHLEEVFEALRKHQLFWVQLLSSSLVTLSLEHS